MGPVRHAQGDLGPFPTGHCSRVVAVVDPMFDLPGFDNVDEIVINEEVVEGRASPLLIYSEQREERSSGAS